MFHCSRKYEPGLFLPIYHHVCQDQIEGLSHRSCRASCETGRIPGSSTLFTMEQTKQNPRKQSEPLRNAYGTDILLQLLQRMRNTWNRLPSKLEHLQWTIPDTPNSLPLQVFQVYVIFSFGVRWKSFCPASKRLRHFFW